jgi:hypothetical protein
MDEGALGIRIHLIDSIAAWSHDWLSPPRSSSLFHYHPSVNNLFLNVTRGGRMKSARHRAWEREADAGKPDAQCLLLDSSHQ